MCTPNYDVRQTDCKEGYMGNACAQCIQGPYYKAISGECRVCPSISAGMVLAIHRHGTLDSPGVALADLVANTGSLTSSRRRRAS